MKPHDAICFVFLGGVLTHEDYLVLSSGFGKNGRIWRRSLHSGVCELVGQQNGVTVSGTFPQAKPGSL